MAMAPSVLYYTILCFVGGAVIAGLIAMIVFVMRYFRYPIMVPIFREGAEKSFTIGYDRAGRFKKKTGGYVYRTRKLKEEFTIEDPSYKYQGTTLGGFFSSFFTYSTIALLERVEGGAKIYKPCILVLGDKRISLEPTSRNVMLDKISNDSFIKVYHDVERGERIRKAVITAVVIFIIIAVIIILATKGKDIWSQIQGIFRK